MASSELTKSKQQVSTMLKQGFISDYFLSPPPSSPSESTRPIQAPIRSTPSPTLFEMMTEEQTRDSRPSAHSHPHSLDTARIRVEERVARVLSGAPFKNPSDWGLGFADVSLTLTARDGFSVSMDVHRQVLVRRSQFFREKLGRRSGSHHSVEICECDDVEVYLETLLLMYYDDPKKKMIGEGVSKILGLLKLQLKHASLASATTLNVIHHTRNVSQILLSLRSPFCHTTTSSTIKILTCRQPWKSSSPPMHFPHLTKNSTKVCSYCILFSFRNFGGGASCVGGSSNWRD